MALYRREHSLKERSLEWESCVEWDTRGALSMGTLFLGHELPPQRRLHPLTIDPQVLPLTEGCRYLFSGSKKPRLV